MRIIEKRNLAVKIILTLDHIYSTASTILDRLDPTKRGTICNVANKLKELEIAGYVTGYKSGSAKHYQLTERGEKLWRALVVIRECEDGR